MAQYDQPTTETAACCTVPSIGNGLTNQPAGSTCPHCGVRGKLVDTRTLKAMLAVSLVALQPVAYYFCPTVQCPVVYFATGGRQTFTESDLRERVYQKHPDDAAVFVCYCFRHTLGTIRAEGLTTKASAVIEQIKTGIAAGQCACEIRNPQGSCCLGNVSAVVKQTMQEATTVALEV